MRTARWIVCERTGTWAAALRTRLRQRGDDLPGGLIREARGLAECQPLLCRWPASVVALEVTRTDFSACVDWVVELEHRFPRALAVILSQLDLPEAEWALREAGAGHVIRSLRDVELVTQLAVRHVRRAPRAHIGAVERILAELPWSGLVA